MCISASTTLGSDVNAGDIIGYVCPNTDDARSLCALGTNPTHLAVTLSFLQDNHLVSADQDELLLMFANLQLHDCYRKTTEEGNNTPAASAVPSTLTVDGQEITLIHDTFCETFIGAAQ